jgi:nitric oxide reductase activation protein
MDNGTPTVDDIINGLTELSTRREARKAFVLFTDGEPSYYGKMAPAAYNYAKDMLDRARQAGYKVFGFGLGVDQKHPLMNFLFKEGWVGIDTQANPGDEAVKIMERLREAFL